MNQVIGSKFPLVIAALALFALAGCPQLSPPPGAVAVTGVSLNATSRSLVVGSTYQLSATIAPFNASSLNVIWASDTPADVTVSTSGLLTAIAAGTAVVTVTTSDGSKTASCIVTVTSAPVAVTGVSLNPTSKTIPAGGSFQLTPTIIPANATNTDVSWESDTPPVATVSTTGLVTAVAVGTATITVTTADGGKTATCVVTVVVAVASVSLDIPAKTVFAQGSFQLTTTVLPVDASDKTVTWSSGDISVATVSAIGLVTGVTSGRTTITVTTNDGGKTASSVVTVAPIARWADSVGGATAASRFQGIAADSSGNVYAAGYMGGGTNDFGNSVTATGPNGLSNMVLVKYNSSGVAQWARTLVSGGNSHLDAITVDSAGNVYVAGYIIGSSGLVSDFGNGVTVTNGFYGGWTNPLLIKYDPSGTPQWARSVTTASINNDSQFVAVAVDSSGNVFAGGYIEGQIGTYLFGNNVSASTVTNSLGALLVKYDSSGTPQWAQSVASGNASEIGALAVDSLGNIFAGGVIWGQTDFGNNIKPAGSDAGNYNIVLVKYDTSGVAQWAQTTTAGSAESSISSIALDSSGNIYAVGHMTENGLFGFGNSVTAQGTATNFGFGANALIVKYDSAGTAQWARSVTSGVKNSQFQAVAIDASGSPVVVGSLSGNGQFGFGNSISAVGPYSGGNTLLMQCDPSGNALWASTAPAAPSDSIFNSVAAGPTGAVFAAGMINTAGQFNFGNSVTAQGSFSAVNCILVNYR